MSFLGIDGEGNVPDDGNGEPDPIFFFRDIPSSTNRPFDAYILDGSGNISTDPEASKELMVAIQLESPTQIGTNTTSIDVGFKATDMVAFAMRPCTEDEIASDCIDAGFIGGLDFYARTE